MSAHNNSYDSSWAGGSRVLKDSSSTEKQSSKTNIAQHSEKNLNMLSYKNIMQLQNTIGNKSVIQLLQGLVNTSNLQGNIQQIDMHKNQQSTAPIQKKENRTGLPDNLKQGIEQLSGMSMDEVKVHYNSDKPKEVGALAYTEGTDIHVGAGQEKHLSHEAWHVVQQMQGRVIPTKQMKKIAINDDPKLEAEANEMGKKALEIKSDATVNQISHQLLKSDRQMQKDTPRKVSCGVAQRLIAKEGYDYTRLYAPKQWMDTIIKDNNGKTISDVLHCNGEGTDKVKKELRQGLIDNINAAANINLINKQPPEEIIQTDSTKLIFKEVFDIQMSDGINHKKHHKRSLKSQIKQKVESDLNNLNRVRIVPMDVSDETKWDSLRKEPISAPYEIIREKKSDLEGEHGEALPYNHEYACTLIAIVKSQGINEDAEREECERLHDLYWKMPYDDTANHPVLLGKFGFKMVFSGDCSFTDLPKELDKPLTPEKKYIIDITGHTVYVEMKKTLNPNKDNGIQINEVNQYFSFNSDRQGNFNETGSSYGS